MKVSCLLSYACGTDEISRFGRVFFRNPSYATLSQASSSRCLAWVIRRTPCKSSLSIRKFNHAEAAVADSTPRGESYFFAYSS